MDEIEVSASELASAFGVTDRTVRSLENKGFVVKSGHGKYLLMESIRLYCEHLREVASGRGGEDGVFDLTKERARLAKEQADAQSLKNAVSRSEFISIDEVSCRSNI